MKLYNVWFILLAVGLFMSCQEGKKSTKRSKEEMVFYNPKSKITSPDKNRFSAGDTITITVESTDTATEIDSVQIYVNSQYLTTISQSPFSYDLNTNELAVGNLHIRTVTFNQDQSQDISRSSVVLTSDIEPVQYTYRVVQSFPHDPEAFTQGLVFDGSYLYEGTGQKGESSLRQIDLPSGEIVKIEYLDTDFFGEGITIYQNKIIQLTWKSRVGFVYDLTTFDLQKKFNYPTEGWGITTVEDHLIMSDGTATLYRLDPQSYNEIGRFEVYDQNGPVSDLNELEFIDGMIYANVFQTDQIAIIDPVTGKVTGMINLEGLLEEQLVNNRTDVLNGIAYDQRQNRILVTGKWWPRIYHIQLVPLETSPFAYQQF
ncbi:MAG: glutaminyl-peptide cyclotransferase [Candidatus Cyclobacteriaceae bacterium M3_2C_046]